MERIRDEKTIAHLVLLKILDNKINDDLESSLYAKGLFEINENISINGKIYETDHDIFVKVINNLSLNDGLIRIIARKNGSHSYIVRNMEKIRQRVSDHNSLEFNIESNDGQSNSNHKDSKEINSLEFNDEKGILKINNKSIKFTKHKDPFNVLRYIFNNNLNGGGECFFDEISQVYNPNIEFVKDKKYHNAVMQIKRRVFDKTGINDLFYTTTQSVKIDSKYLQINTKNSE